jgi:hypothetical protein
MLSIIIRLITVANYNVNCSCGTNNDYTVTQYVCEYLLCRIKKGGADTGFRSAVIEKPVQRLFHFHGDRKGVVVKEVCIWMCMIYL